MTVNDLYDIADKNNIKVHNFKFKTIEAVSVPYNIGIDYRKLENDIDLKDKLSHELAHCMTGSFYNADNPLDVRGQHERKAELWQFEQLMPLDDLIDVLIKGYCEIWQIAEYFEVSYSLAEKAVEYYQNNYDLESMLEDKIKTE